MRLNLSWRKPSAEEMDQTHCSDPVQATRPGRASRWLVALRAACCGLLVGVLVVLYRQGIGYGTRFARWAYSQMRNQPLIILPWLLAALLVGLALAWMVRRVPMASGSGIPQVEGVVIHGMRMPALPVLGVRFLGGLACGMFGLSLGREGPSVQIGAAGSQMVSRGLRRDRVEETCLVTSGAAAGLSAAFNAPLSGMVFALEEIHRSFSPMILLSAAMACLSADFIAKNRFGLRPVLDFTAMPQLTIAQYLLMIPLGLVAGLVGAAMDRLLLGAQSLYSHLPSKLGPVISLFLALPVGLVLPAVLGGGEDLIGKAEGVRDVAWSVAINLLVLLLVKMLFTATSFGSGAPGGIFMPILAVGTLTGSLCGMGAAALGMPVRIIPVCAVCAMAGTLTASVKAPITSILLTVEMSGSLVHMLPVALCAFTALMVSDLLGVQPIYEALLERYRRGRAPDAQVPDRVTVEFPIEHGSPAAGCLLGQVPWPHGCAVIGLRRGEHRLIPAGDLRLLAGDGVILLCPGDRLDQARRVMESLCR